MFAPSGPHIIGCNAKGVIHGTLSSKWGWKLMQYYLHKLIEFGLTMHSLFLGSVLTHFEVSILHSRYSYFVSKWNFHVEVRLFSFPRGLFSFQHGGSFHFEVVSTSKTVSQFTDILKKYHQTVKSWGVVIFSKDYLHFEVEVPF